MTTQNVNALSPVGYLNKMTGHIWTPIEQPDAADQPGIYEPLVLSREALTVVQQKDALQLSVDNILRGLGITGDGPFSQLVLEKFLVTQADALDVFANAAEAELAKGKETANVIDTGFNRGAEAMISMMRMSAMALRAGRKG